MLLPTKPAANDSFEVERRELNVAGLIRAGAIRITYAANGRGGYVKNTDPNSFSIVTLENETSKDKAAAFVRSWPNKPISYHAAEIAINQSMPNLGPYALVGDEKYQQIISSGRKMKIPEREIFADEHGLA